MSSGRLLYNISSLKLLEENKEEATNPFFYLIDYPLYISKLVWNNPLCYFKGLPDKISMK